MVIMHVVGLVTKRTQKKFLLKNIRVLVNKHVKILRIMVLKKSKFMKMCFCTGPGLVIEGT